MSEPLAEKMPRLHLLMSANDAAIRDCLALFRPGDYLLLVDQGVAVLAHQQRTESLLAVVGECIGALRADVLARGLDVEPGRAEIQLLSDLEWAEKVAMHTQVLSWK